MNASDLEDAAQQSGSLAHAQQAHRFGIEQIGPCDPTAVIFHFQSNSAIGFFQIDQHLGGAGVTNDVGQGLLENPEKSGAQVLIRQGFANPGSHVAFDPGPILELVSLPLDGGDQAQVVQHSRTQFAGNAPDGLDGWIDVRCQGPGFVQQRLHLGGQSTGNPGQIQFQAGQGLA